ncbi:hypothetical protein JWZ98_06290 [Methylomonas sp. EFPC1]|uniref:hypothetical protein n=1 Tax=unclassified Methylomonas TaxID=2608980 RepID=UPI00051C126F|nr:MULTISPECIES: hypothetical protein [unclassified Methylomonas]NOV28478.1 hypothetical protein [Methylomonas sp. ZR1]PKD41916.1 hypothetical protein CWO84_02490 [Methylomonas sp. Kb3]QBC26690.1 hypothetical protein U737_07070 [Methylomonas sp. LW13]QSB02549.1 hypothetical protein JWZ98_06290 [Methylomonas sp. EFPC1]
MNKLVSILGVASVFASGYFAGQQFPGRGDSHSAALPENTASVSAPVIAVGANRKLDMSRTNVPVSKEIRLPPHEQQRQALANGLSPEDEVARSEANADLIASMRANHLPEEQVAQLEQTLKDQESATPVQPEEPVSERTNAELSAELRESLKQSGAPPEIINAMAQPLEAGATTTDEPVLPHKNHIPGS